MNSSVQIVAYQCKKCGRVHYPFHERCLACLGRDFEEIPAEGKPKLLAYTQIFNLPWGFDSRFLIIGIVEFENHVKAMGQIRADSREHIKSGMQLTPAWEPIREVAGEHVYGLVLHPK